MVQPYTAKRKENTLHNSAASQVWNNTLIMDGVAQYMAAGSLAQLCLACKQGWIYAIEQLWTCPKLTHMKYFNRFSASIAHQPLFKVGNHTHYGGLVRNLDLSMLGGRWEKIGYVQLAPVLAFCTNITSLDLDLCQHIGDSHFLKLFVDNPHLSEKLTHLDLDEVMLMDQTIGAIIRMLPKLKYLHLSETNAGPLTCKAIGSCLTDLQYLELSRCIDIDDSCIETIAEKCKSLSYLKIQGCDNIITDDVEELMLERDNLATISEGSDDNYESDDNIDDIGDGFGGSIVGVLSRNTNLLGRYRFDDNDIDID